jgi:competence protein ComEA
MGKIIAGKPYRTGVLFAVVVAAVLALAAGSALAAGALVDINTADQKTLESLPGVGPATAKEIVKGRPYQKPEDIMKVKGIKQKTYDKIKDLITVQ